MLNFSRKAGDIPGFIDILPPERAATVKPARHLFADACIVEDAEFELVRADEVPPPRAPGTTSSPTAGCRRSPSAASVTANVRFPRFFATYGFALTVGLVSAVTFWISGGHALAN